MPRTNLCQREKPHQRVGALIAGAAISRGYTIGALGPIICASENTARSRIRNPGSLTVDELVKLGRKLQIPIDELRAAIRY